MPSLRFILPALAVLAAATAAPAAPAAARPNFLWISCEDTSPWFGFCGDPYATTPHLDRLARAGVHYTRAFATAPVCSPCRSAIITGRYATRLGTQRLRSAFPIPAEIHGYPSYLRAAGYYCTNNAKTDYNTSAERRLIDESWDASSGRAHWRDRRPGQPFFAVFNLMETHQSRAFGEEPVPGLDPSERHDPAKAVVPPYYPDTAEARRTLARVYDCITAMDKRAGALLAELEQAGLADDTIVFFWPDHGQGLPRGKRTLWDTGLKVPLVIRFPPKFRHLASSAPGTTSDRLVYLMDLGPTLLSLAGVPPPAGLDARAFLGRAAAAPRDYLHGARDRVDEAGDLARSVRDARYLYIRNYQPDLPWHQPEGFSDQLAFRRELTRLAAAGRLNAAQLTYAGATKPLELLYDTANDPFQVHNLADDPQLRPVLERLRGELRRWTRETRDLGFLAEWQAHQLAAGQPSLLAAAATERAYPLDRILEAADQVGRPGTAAACVARLADADPTVRYWAALGLRAAHRLSAPGSADAAVLAAEPARAALRRALDDASIPVRVAAAEVLVALAEDRAALTLLATLLRDPDAVVNTDAARALELLGAKARPVIGVMREVLAGQPHLYLEFSLRAALRGLGDAG